MNLGSRAWNLLLDLAAYKSVSQTRGEGEIARFIYSRLGNHPYFRTNPALLRFLALPAPNQPGVVAALVRGKGDKTVLILNHHDVVEAEGYGPYKDLAFSPLALTKALDPAALPAQAREDLAGGEWVFGRGTMDMLFGLALQLEMTLDRAAAPAVPGNILFVSVPDEENNSLGMRHAVSLIREIQQEHYLDFTACLNCEPHGYDKDGHVVQTGSDGKLLALVCCFGRVTHAGALYEGLNPHLLLAETVRLLELNPGFCDRAAGALTFPPTVLRGGDSKGGYNVTTPANAWAFFNIFTLAAAPEEILAKLARLCQQAAANAQEKVIRSAQAWAHMSGEALAPPSWQPRVLTYAQLRLEAGQGLDSRLDALAAVLQEQGADLQQLTLALVEETHRASPDQAPKIVVALAPPFYPPVCNSRQSKKEQNIMAAVKDLQGFARGLGVELVHAEFHRGISDLSYGSLQDPGDGRAFQENCPAWGRAYHLPLAEMAKIGAPALNLGPWGRDVHQWTERIHYPFATVTLPRLLQRLVRRLLG